MFKHSVTIFGLGLTLALSGCAQTESQAPSPDQAKTENSEANKPSDRPQRDGQRRAPPEAAFAACDSLAVNSACSVETPRGTRDGVCRTRPDNDRAFCAPSRPDGARGEGRRPRPEGQRPGGR